MAIEEGDEEEKCKGIKAKLRWGLEPDMKMKEIATLQSISNLCKEPCLKQLSNVSFKDITFSFHRTITVAT